MKTPILRYFYSTPEKRKIINFINFILLIYLVVTFHPVADGDYSAYIMSVIQLVAGSIFVGFMVSRQYSSRPHFAEYSALLLIITGAAIHTTRLVHPLTREIQDIEISRRGTDISIPQKDIYEIMTSGQGRASETEHGLSFSIEPLGAAAIRLIPPEPPTVWPWWAPLRAAKLGRTHIFIIDASISRTAPYLSLIDTGRTRIQLTSSGIMITAPDGTGDVRETTLTSPVVAGTGFHQWELRLFPLRATLTIDGSEVWSIPRDPHPGRVFTIGDASQDREHGGTITLKSFHYERLPTPRE